MSTEKSATRLYFVTDGTHDWLVRATSQAQALRHVAKDTFTVRVASQNDIVEYLESGDTIETANEQLDLADGESK